jgi:hypothetical protein
MNNLDMHLGIGSRVQHARMGQGVVIANRYHSYLITFIDEGTHEVDKNDPMLETLHAENVNPELETISAVEKSLLGILRQWAGVQEVVELGDKWKGGVLEIKSANPNIKSKEIPIDVFFHKIVMLRDRLRVMEQQINAHKLLSDEDKVNLQQYITRIYGTLTTFNVLFKSKEDYFVGEKAKED